MVANGKTEHARRNQHLIVGPWTHTLDNLVRQVGEVDFGPEACRDYYEIADQWFSRWLKDEENALDDWPPIQLFVMGANQWRAECEWPLARTAYTEYYMHSGGHAGTAAGDGTLTPEPPGEEPADEYSYDPRDPVMTLYTPGGQHEPIDQRSLDGRRDVLVYTTPPTGRIPRSHRAGAGPAVGGLLGARHRLCGQTARRLAGGFRTRIVPRHSAGAIPGFHFRANTHRAQPGLRVHHSDESDQQPVQARAPGAAGSIQQ